MKNNNNYEKLPTDSLVHQLYEDKAKVEELKDQEMEKLKMALSKEEFFIDLDRKGASEFLRDAPIGTFLFRLSFTAPMTLDFCFIALGVRTIQWQIIQKEDKFHFRNEEQEYSSLAELIENKKESYIKKIAGYVDEKIEEINSFLTAKEKSFAERWLEINRVTHVENNSEPSLDDIGNNMDKVEIALNYCRKFATERHQLKQEKLILDAVQPGITNKTILRSYMEWIKDQYLNDTNLYKWRHRPLKIYTRILENLYIHHKEEIKNGCIANVDIKDIPAFITAAKLGIDARNARNFREFIEQKIFEKGYDESKLKELLAEELIQFVKSKVVAPKGTEEKCLVM